MVQSWAPLVFGERLVLGLSPMIAPALTVLVLADVDVTRAFSTMAVA